MTDSRAAHLSPSAAQPGGFRVLVLCPDVLSGPQYGPNIRAIAMARELSRHFPVTLGLKLPAGTSPAEAPPRPDELQTVWWDRSSVGALLEHHRVVVSLGMQYPARLVATTSAVQVFDLYDPVVLEHLAGHDLATGGGEADQAALGHLQALTRLLLQCGDYFLCASPQQRDLWLGGLYATGRLARSGCGDALEGDRAAVGLVPFGHDGSVPPPHRPVLKGVHPKIASADRLLLWGGGIWNWSDPLTLIRAVAALSKRRNDVKLFFMASRHAGGDSVGREMLERAVALARELGVLGESVLFNETWVKFEERSAYLQESDLAVCTTPEGLENHFSFRTRLVDALWCGVPIICTRDGFFGDYVDRERLGFTVGGGDVEELQRKLEQALEPEAQTAFRASLAVRRDDLRWDRCLEPLVAFCRRVEEGRYRAAERTPWQRWGRYLEYKAASLLQGRK